MEYHTTVALVALESSGAQASVAVGVGDELRAEVVIEGSLQPAAGLIPAVDKALREAQLTRTELNGVVVGEGPGSFTGVRVAAATGKGLAQALTVPLWAVPSLLAAALATEVGSVRYVLFDARADRVYGACYSIDGSVVKELVPSHAGTLTEVFERDIPRGTVFMGNGAERHRAAIEKKGFLVVPNDGKRTYASGLLRYLSLEPDAEPVANLETWEPRYIRTSSAERLWTGQTTTGE
mgnify:FL=1